MGDLHVLSHPLIVHKLTLMRSHNTKSKDFRQLLREITLLMAYEVTRDFPLAPTSVRTPLTTASFPALSDLAVTIVPILRAGLGMVEGFQELLPFANIGHLGMYRDETTHTPVEYYSRMPLDVDKSRVIVVDPMLATGGSAVDAIDRLKELGCSDIRLVNLLAAPEGVKAMREAHPDIDIFVAAIDEGLDEDAYIIPGLGDAGDRIFGTL